MTASLFGWQIAMTSPAAALMPSASDVRMRSSALTLAFAGGIEYGLQLVVPIVLAHRLDPTVFGQYRFLWLLAGTVLAIAPAFMPQALFYLLPRAEPGQRRLLIGNVLVYLAFVACLVGVVAIGWNSIFPAAADSLFFETAGISTIFLSLWMAASLLDVLPSAEGRARWQSGAIIAMAVLRALLLAGAAIVASDIFGMVSAMLAVAVVKLMVLAYYLYSRQERLSWQVIGIKNQLAYCVPFAIGNTLFLLQLQADQWVVASMLTPAQYAVFSIAAVMLPIASLIRRAVNTALMPALNSAHAQGNFPEIRRLIATTNASSAIFLLPISGLLLVILPDFVCLVYTCRYIEAVPIMRVYLISLIAAAFAVGHVLPALGKGRFAAINSACCLVLSVFSSIVGVHQFGMIGAALGSVLSLAVGELWSVQVVSRTLGVSMRQLQAWRALAPVFLSTGTAVVAVAMLGNFVSGTAFTMLLLNGTVYSAVFVICFALSGGRQTLALLTGRRSADAGEV
jgi:O-antigen/teichoic acid export membrane protein